MPFDDLSTCYLNHERAIQKYPRLFGRNEYLQTFFRFSGNAQTIKWLQHFRAQNAHHRDMLSVQSKIFRDWVTYGVRLTQICYQWVKHAKIHRLIKALGHSNGKRWTKHFVRPPTQNRGMGTSG